MIKLFGQATLVACLLALAVFNTQTSLSSNGLVAAEAMTDLGIVSLHARSPQNNGGSGSGGSGSSGNSNSNSTSNSNGGSSGGKNSTSSNGNGGGSNSNSTSSDGGDNGDSGDDTDTSSDQSSILTMVRPYFNWKDPPTGFNIGDTIYFQWTYDEKTLYNKPQNVTLEIARESKDFAVIGTVGYSNPTKFQWKMSEWDQQKTGFPLSATRYRLYIYDERGRDNFTDPGGRLRQYSVNFQLYNGGVTCTDCNEASSNLLPTYTTLVVMGAVSLFAKMMT